MKIDPGLATLLVGGASTALGALSGRKRDRLTPEELELLRAQTRGMDANTRGTEVETAGRETANALSQIKLKRKQDTDPLWRAVRMMAAKRLPIFAQQGFDFSSLEQEASAPAPAAAPSQAGISIDDFLPSERRGGGTGGAAGGAMRGGMAGATAGSFVPGVGNLVGGGIGALVGGIRGAVNKRAATAPTDFSVEDARATLARAYQQFFGRPADPAVIEETIRGQGWQPGDRWVGEGGLRSILQTWQQQAGR